MTKSEHIKVLESRIKELEQTKQEQEIRRLEKKCESLTDDIRYLGSLIEGIVSEAPLTKEYLSESVESIYQKRNLK